MVLDRRAFLAGSAAALGSLTAWCQEYRPREVVLRSGWQTINIGDVAHTPGVLRLLERYAPGCHVTLWGANLGDGVEAMLRRNFPKVDVVTDKLGPMNKPTEKLDALFKGMDLFLHGSGPSVVSPQAFPICREMKKPYGIYGVTLGDITPSLKTDLSAAAFVFCRDTLSLEALKASGVTGPTMGFTPEGTFAFHLRDDDKATAYLKAAGLEAGKFLCVVPRLRWTPYKTLSEAELKRRTEVNEQFAEVDHAKLRAVIAAWVKETGLPVLVCPEMTYQIDVGKKLLVEPLPDEVRKKVVHRDTFWLPDEAASVYARALGVVSCEMHSPILAFSQGTPAIYVRQPTDTRKGQMWRDVGLKEWIFEIDDAAGPEIAKVAVSFAQEREAALAKLKAAREGVDRTQKETMAVVAKAAGVA